MARVTHVKKAQVRYETRPVLDAGGNPIKIALTRKDGSPKMTSGKRGKAPRPVFITKTEPDKSRPKPNHKCGKCGTEILPGMPYKWIKPKSGPYGGRLMVRCGPCPTWQVWDYSSSMPAQLARISHDAHEAADAAEGPDDVTAALNDAAEAIRDLAEQKRESAQNIVDGFGHDTYQSDELNETAENLDTWADEVESADVPELDEHPCQSCTEGQAECDTCSGTGKVETEDEGGNPAEEDCPDCDGMGEAECSWCDGDGTDLEAWREAVQDVLSIVDESPV